MIINVINKLVNRLVITVYGDFFLEHCLHKISLYGLEKFTLFLCHDKNFEQFQVQNILLL